MKGYAVFNLELVDSAPQPYQPKLVSQPEAGRQHNLSQVVETVFAKTSAVIEHEGDGAFCAITRNLIRLPHSAEFVDAEANPATKAHEFTRWTRHTYRPQSRFRVKAFR